MIPFLRGWARRISGDAVTLYPPGPPVGAIRYRERVRPLGRVSLIVEQLLARYPLFQATAIGAPERLVTAEGEYAALLKIDGQVNGNPAQRDLGFVFGDDFYALISAIALTADRFAEFSQHVRVLTRLDSHALGVRRRRFLYDPPPGWQGLPRGAAAEWMPPDFPKNPSLIQVFPANPVDRPAESVLGKMVADDSDGFAVVATRGPEPVAAQGGLSGWSWTVAGALPGRPRARRELVVLKDARYLYPLRLETVDEDRPAERRLFLDLVGSVHPIPMPGGLPDEGELGGLVGHWAL